MNIQLATAEDAPTLAQIHVTTWQTAYVGMIDSDYLNNLDVSKITSDWQNALSKPSPGITVIGKQDDHAIGFAVYGPTRDEGVDKTKTAELVALNVLPDYWRHGYGKEFVSHILNDVTSQGYQDVTLWVIRENERARRFYEALGFVDDNTEKQETRLTIKPVFTLRYRKFLIH